MTKLITPEAEKALTLPVGMASPLWLMFAGAAAAGAAMFWARAWFKPTNLEAVLAPLPAPAPETAEPIIEAVEDAVMLAVETTEATLEVAAEVIEATTEATAERVEDAIEVVESVAGPLAETAPEAVEAVAESLIETAPEVVDVVTEPAVVGADDLTKLTGIGPKLAGLLAERGVTRFADIAAWTAEDVAAFDRDMKLMGRIDREAWVAQARRYSDAQ
jgi:predicted flap endonuclease-1-like 5' DNA nuclease